ncbi:MAG: hypothetical protein M1401_04130 [Chloroflexi bacterium]|nr:hypothetical protein [Chloroflexota bacterium]
MVREILAYVPVLLTWAAVAYKLLAFLRSPGEPGLRSFWFGLLALALSLTTLLPPVYLGIDRLVGISNLARLLAHCLMAVAAWSIHMFLFYLNYPDARTRPGRRREVFLLGLTLALLIGLFALADVREETLDFTSRYADTPFIAEYRLVLIGYLGLVLANAARLSWRYAGISAMRPSLHLGLRLVAIGATVGLGYSAHGAFYLAARRFDLGYPFGDEELVSDALLAVCLVLVLVGSTMPAWGARLGIPALHAWAVRYRACRRLYPLWRDLYRANPQIALIPPSGAVCDALTLRGTGFRLYRRVVEIRDAQLALRPHVDPRAAVHAAALCRESGIVGEEAGTVTEAARLASALRAKEQGRVFGDPERAPRMPGWGDVQREAAFLSRVALHYIRSPIVHAVLARLEQEDVEAVPVVREAHGTIGPSGDIHPRPVERAGRGSRRQLARLVTELLAPAPTVAMLLLVVSWHSAAAASEALRWALLSVLFAAALPFLYIVRGVRRKRLTDIHVYRREQRPRVLLIGIGSVLVGFTLLTLLGAPRDLVALVGAMAVGLASSTLVTLFWKVSVHTAVNSGAVTILVLVFGEGLLVVAPLVALVGWARVQVKDHSPAQVVVGAALGAAVAAAVFPLLR